MNVRPIALILLLAVSLTGCARSTCTNTATIVVQLPLHSPPNSRILIDPSLNPEVNETHGAWFPGHTVQRVVINTAGPVKLIPDAPKDHAPDKVAIEHTATIVINGLPKPPRNYPILIEPGLNPEVNKTHAAWNIWTPAGDINQRVVIHSEVPLRLVPASPEELERLMPVEWGSGPSQSPPPYRQEASAQPLVPSATR
jgi:hypothetical protein